MQLFYFPLLSEKAVFLVLIKCSNWIPYFWENNIDMLVYADI